LKAGFFLQVSGGFARLIEPVAARLGIAKSQVYANVLLFDDVTREYKGFDYAQPTSESGGKARACETILQTGAHQTLVMVGDGVTDMEAAPPADAAIGFGGHVVREAVCSYFAQIDPTSFHYQVVAKAGWFVHSFDELIFELDTG
jgi:phosphoserine phosphatase